MDTLDRGDEIDLDASSYSVCNFHFVKAVKGKKELMHRPELWPNLKADLDAVINAPTTWIAEVITSANLTPNQT